MQTMKRSFWNWKSFLVAFVIAALIHGITSAAAGTTPRKNIIWTTIWIYMTIEAWKYWKWKALLPYPIYLLTVIIAVWIMESAGVNYAESLGVKYPSWTSIIVLTSLNICGLILFSISLIKEYTQVSNRTEAQRAPSNLTTVKQEKAEPGESVDRYVSAELSSERFLIDSETKKCPFCTEIIKIEAVKCRYCGESLDNKPATVDSDGHIKSPQKSQTSIISSRQIDNSEAPNAWKWTANKTQRIILLLTAAVLILMLLFPPFYFSNGTAKISKGYRFILNPIKMAYWDKEAEMQAAKSFQKYIMSDEGRASLSDDYLKMNFDFMRDPRWEALDPETKNDYLTTAFERYTASEPEWKSTSSNIRERTKEIFFQDAKVVEQKLKMLKDTYLDDEKKKYPKMIESVPPLVDTFQLLAQAIIVILVGGILCFALKDEK